MTILCSPKIGAGFVQLIGTLGPDARTEYPYATLPHEESFLYVLDGEIELEADVAGEKNLIHRAATAMPCGKGIGWRNVNGKGRPHSAL